MSGVREVHHAVPPEVSCRRNVASEPSARPAAVPTLSFRRLPGLRILLGDADVAVLDIGMPLLNGIEAATVDTHRAHSLQKLDLHNTAELVLYAVRHGVIS